MLPPFYSPEASNYSYNDEEYELREESDDEEQEDTADYIKGWSRTFTNSLVNSRALGGSLLSFVYF